MSEFSDLTDSQLAARLTREAALIEGQGDDRWMADDVTVALLRAARDRLKEWT